MNGINKSTKSLVIFTMVYFAILIYLLFFAFFRTNTNTTVNWIPFKNIIDLTGYTFKTGHGILHWIINVPGNVIAFVPMAIPLNYLKLKINSWVYWMILFLVPVFCEFLQYFFQSGSADIDDVILNITGILLGLYLIRKLSAGKFFNGDDKKKSDQN